MNKSSLTEREIVLFSMIVCIILKVTLVMRGILK